MNVFLYVAICFVLEIGWEFTMFSKANKLHANDEVARAENYFLLGIISIWVGPMIFLLLGLAIASVI